MTIRSPAHLLVLLVELGCRRAGWVVAAAAALAIGSVVYVAGHARMTSDTTQLISPGVAWRVAERRMDSAFPRNGDATLVVVDGATPELAEQGAAALAGRLAGDRAHVRSVRRLDGGDYFGREGLLFGTPPEVAHTAARLIEAQPFLGPLAADPSLRGVASALGTILQGIERGEARIDRLEPAMGRLADALQAQAAGRPAFFSWQALIGGASAPTRQLLLVRPVLDYDALMPGAASSAAIRGAAAALGLDARHGARVRLTGSVPLSDEEFASLADRWWLVASAMGAAMVATLWLATRSLRVTAAILVTTIAGLIVTAAAGLMAVGRLNLISVAFVPLFVGLGVDFGIQLAVRFQAERHAGRTPADAIGEAAARLGPALLLAAGAVCLGFLAFLPTAYLGIAELGVFASAGMVIALLASATLLPALLTLLRPGRPRAAVESPRLAAADALLLAEQRPILIGFVVALALSVASLWFVRFDFDPLHLRAPDGEAMATLADLRRDPDRTPNTIAVLTPDIAAARALAARLERVPEVAHAITAASFVPEDQPAKLAAIADARGLLAFSLDPIEALPAPNAGDNAAALRATADALDRAAGASAAGRDARRLAAAFRRLAGSPAAQGRATALLVPPLRTMLAQIRLALSAGPVTLADLPADLRRDWIAPDGRARVEVVPKPVFADDAGLPRFTHAVLAVAPEASGTAVSIQGAARTVTGAFVQAGVLALGIVTALLLLALRDVREVAFTLAPVVLSGFLTLGTCVLIGQPINFANIIAFPLLFGVGTAFHIYFVMAWRAGVTGLLQSSLARAIFFSALATGTAFGSLWLSDHPGTASMGKVLMLSLAWTLVCALVFEPALLGPPRAGRRDVAPH